MNIERGSSEIDGFEYKITFDEEVGQITFFRPVAFLTAILLYSYDTNIFNFN